MTTIEDPYMAKLEKLRAEFPNASVGYLPKVTCFQCRDSRTKNCEKHEKKKCPKCNNYMTTAHVDLDYIGHAVVTDRLLTIDLEWDWEPVERDTNPHHLSSAIETGNPEVLRAYLNSCPPKFVRDEKQNPVGLWIYLTVGGMTRKGYGTASWNAGDGEKELIGDAIRNAALRFGVALEYWSANAELESLIQEQDQPNKNTTTVEPPPPPTKGKKGRPPTEKALEAAGATPEDHALAVQTVSELSARDLSEALSERNLALGGSVEDRRKRLIAALTKDVAEARKREEAPADGPCRFCGAPPGTDHDLDLHADKEQD